MASLVVAVAAGRAGAEVLVWAVAPCLLLAVADAAYSMEATRVASMAAKETVRAEDLFRMQSGNAGFAVSIQSLKGLASFSVWPFYAALITMVIVLGRTVLPPQHNPQFTPQNSSINGSPYLPNAPRPAYTIQQPPGMSIPPGAVVYPANANMVPPTNFTPPNGAPSFQPPPNQVTVTRPNMPPMGVPPAKPNAPGAASKAPTVPGGGPTAPSSLNPSAQPPFTPQTPKTQQAPKAPQNPSSAKPVTSQPQPPQ